MCKKATRVFKKYRKQVIVFVFLFSFISISGAFFANPLILQMGEELSAFESIDCEKDFTGNETLISIYTNPCLKMFAHVFYLSNPYQDPLLNFPFNHSPPDYV